jgi:hypothetical protein
MKKWQKQIYPHLHYWDTINLLYIYIIFILFLFSILYLTYHELNGGAHDFIFLFLENKNLFSYVYIKIVIF